MRVPEPRHDRTRPRGWLSLFWGAGGKLVVFVTIPFLIISGMAILQQVQADRFDREGIEILAKVVDREVRRSSDDTDYYLTFQVPIPEYSAPIRVRKKVSSSEYAAAPQGSEQPVRYLRSDPRRIEYPLGDNRTTGRSLQILSGIAGIVALALLWWRGMKTNRGMLARRHGDRTGATIREIVERKSSGRATGKGYMVWVTDDGLRGESLDRPIADLERLGVNSRIVIYRRGDDTWWEGDVGPRAYDAGRVPKVPR